jgi:hypothetical protein
MVDKKFSATGKTFAWLFFLTGVFAIVGALFTWGIGWLFKQTELNTSLLPIADLIIAGPLSIISSYGLFRKKTWGVILGLLTCGVYVFGSVLVYIQVIWIGSPYNFQLIIPPFFGIGISISFFICVLTSNKKKQFTVLLFP